MNLGKEELGMEELIRLCNEFMKKCEDLERKIGKYKSELASVRYIIDYDALTNVKTRRYIEEILPKEIERSSRTGQPFSVVMADLDGLGEINNTHGHQAGDYFLKEIAQLLKTNLRKVDDVGRCEEEIGRYGGDEFIILLWNADENGAKIVCERIRRVIENHKFQFDEVKPTMSFGIATYPKHGKTHADIIRNADIALYLAKHDEGKVCIYESGMQI